MNHDLPALGDAYLKARDKKEPEGISKFLHPDVRFIGPMQQVTGKEKVLQAAQRVFGLLKTLELRSRFVSGDQALFTYDFVCADPVGLCRTAELLTFNNGLITRIEFFFHARPFEKLMQTQKAVPKSA